MLMDLGLLILRLAVGVVFMAHGSQKLFGWFNGPGIDGTSRFLQSLGLRPSTVWAVVAGLAEFIGGFLIALGFLSPVGPALIVGVMLVAIVTVHWSKGFWNMAGGYEFPLVNVAAATALALTGPGFYAMDRLLQFSLPEPTAQLVTLGAAVVGSAVAVASTTRVGTGRHAEAAS